MDLLAAEITAVTGEDPGVHYAALTGRYGAPVYERSQAPASPPDGDRRPIVEHRGLQDERTGEFDRLVDAPFVATVDIAGRGRHHLLRRSIRPGVAPFHGSSVLRRGRSR